MMPETSRVIANMDMIFKLNQDQRKLLSLPIGYGLCFSVPIYDANVLKDWADSLLIGHHGRNPFIGGEIFYYKGVKCIVHV
jgi:hypothetical protein